MLIENNFNQNELEVYFAFPDSIFYYDCITCDQRCCKTGHLAVFPHEQSQLITHYPALELVATPVYNSLGSFLMPTSGCTFLNKKSCTLYDDAKDKKNTQTYRPSGCSLFPFNIFGLLDNILVLAPNTFCPLKISPEKGYTHKNLTKLLKKHGLAGEYPTLLKDKNPHKRIILERLIRVAAKMTLKENSPIPFLAFQSLATDTFIKGGISALENLDTTKINEVEDKIYERFLKFTHILGIDITEEDLASTSQIITAWTPTLRLFSFNDLPLECLPHGLLALCIYIAKWQITRNDIPLIPQALLQIFNSLKNTIYLLASLDTPFMNHFYISKDKKLSHDFFDTLDIDPLKRNLQIQQITFRL